MAIRDTIQLRPMGPGDLEFLYRVYAGTRTEELAVTGWSDAQKEAFLRMQFNLQHQYYQEHYASAAYDIIEWQGQPIGRLYVHQGATEFTIVDIALLPEHRSAGIGSLLLQKVLNEAAALGKPVRIHVERFNRALQLYERLGFRRIGDTGVYYHLEWVPLGRA